MKYILDIPDGIGECETAVVSGSEGLCFVNMKKLTAMWIPVSERQPEEYGNYLVSTSNGWVVTDYYASYGWDDNSDKDYVVAWMPLPEPYKEVEE